MRYWESSAIAPLILDEATSAGKKRLLTDDPGMTVWYFTPVECGSAIQRRFREGDLTAAQRAEALGMLRDFSERWISVPPEPAIRDGAMRLLGVHPLRAADALQLAAALAAADGDPGRMPFVCADSRLADAARREGFTVIA